MARLTQKQENFCLNLFQGMSQREAYVTAGYSPNQSPATLDRHAYELARTGYILTRWEELRQKAEDDAIADPIERRKVLTEIVRGRFVDFMTKLTPEKLKSAALQEIKITEVDIKGTLVKRTIIKLRDPMQAIDLLNKMDKLYAEGATVNIDNRTLNVIVESEEAKSLTERLASGERT